MYKYIYVNGQLFRMGVDFEKAHITCPTCEEPYWQIDLFSNGIMFKRIMATGQVTVIWENDKKGG